MAERRALLEREAYGLLASDMIPERPSPLSRARVPTGVSGLIQGIARSRMP